MAKYTDKAERVRVVGKTESGDTLITKFFYSPYGRSDDYDDEFEIEGPVEIYTGELFDERPSVDDNGYLQTLQRRCDKLLDECRDLEKRKYKLASEYDTLFSEIVKRQPALVRVLKFLNGDFTHAVLTSKWDAPCIYKATDPEIFDNTRDPAFKLMTLFGDSKGDLAFKVNEYRDGSGGFDKTIHLYESREAALAYVQEWLQVEIAKVLTNHGDCTKLLTTCRINGIPLPDDLAGRVRENVIANKHTVLKGLDKSCEQLRAEIDALQNPSTGEAALARALDDAYET